MTRVQVIYIFIVLNIYLICYFQLVNDYLKDNHWPRRTKDNYDLNVAACRLVMNLIPGLETTVVFESVSKIILFYFIIIIIIHLLPII